MQSELVDPLHIEHDLSHFLQVPFAASEKYPFKSSHFTHSLLVSCTKNSSMHY